MTVPTSFDAPERLSLLLVVVVLVAVYAWQQLRRRRARRAWTSDALLPSAAPRRRGPLRHLTAALLALSLVALTTAFAEPRAEQEVSRERTSVVVALDASASMLATDVAPDRYTAAREAAASFVQELPEGFEVGLVTFAANASLRVPPTRDHEEVVRALDEITLEGGTNVGDALQVALDALTPPGGEPVGAVVLLADGGSTQGSPVEDAVQRAVEAEVPINTIAYGTEDGVLVSGSRSFPVPVDEESLITISETTGGGTYTATTADELVEVLDGVSTRLSTTVEEVDVSAGLVGIGLLLLAVGAAPALLRR